MYKRQQQSRARPITWSNSQKNYHFSKKAFPASPIPPLDTQPSRARPITWSNLQKNYHFSKKAFPASPIPPLDTQQSRARPITWSNLQKEYHFSHPIFLELLRLQDISKERCPSLKRLGNLSDFIFIALKSRVKKWTKILFWNNLKPMIILCRTPMGWAYRPRFWRFCNISSRFEDRTICVFSLIILFIS